MLATVGIKIHIKHIITQANADFFLTALRICSLKAKLVTRKKKLKVRLKINKSETSAMQKNANNPTCLKEVSHWQSETFRAKLRNLILQIKKV